jgi:hypothetical protein
MSERRRGERQVLDHPGVGTMCVVQDVDVAHVDATESVVIAAHTIPRGERLLLTVPDECGAESHTRLARVASSRVVLRNGALRREVRLLISPRVGDSTVLIEQATRRAEQRAVIRGAVIRRVPVRITEVSTSGCLWESPSSLDDGTVGWIDIRGAQHYHSEAVRVLRTQRLEALTWPYRTAVEFLTLGPLSPDSFRGVAALAAVGTH